MENPTVMFINPDDRISPAILARFLNRNVSLLYQWSQIGRLPDIKNSSCTYRECLDFLITSLLKNEEAKKLKILEDAKLKETLALKKDEVRRSKFTTSSGGDYEDSMHPLMAAKLQQNIKTEYAREAELWQKISIKRGEFVAFGDKLDLVEGLVLSIRDTLLHIGNNHPEIQNRVDEAMEELYQLGVTLCSEADIDVENYIDTMLSKDIESITNA